MNGYQHLTLVRDDGILDFTSYSCKGSLESGHQTHHLTDSKVKANHYTP